MNTEVTRITGTHCVPVIRVTTHGYKSRTLQKFCGSEKRMCLSVRHVRALSGGCRRTEGRLSPTLAAKRYDFPLIGWNQVNNDEEKKAWHAGRVYGCQLEVPGGYQSGLTMTQSLGEVSVKLPVFKAPRRHSIIEELLHYYSQV